MKKKASNAAVNSAEEVVQKEIKSLLRQFFDLRGVRISSKGIMFLEPSDFESAKIRKKADILIRRLKRLPGGQEAYDDLVPSYLRGELNPKGWPQQVKKLTSVQKKRLVAITAVFDQCQPGKTVVLITEGRAKPYFAIFEGLEPADGEYSDGPYIPDLLSLTTGYKRYREHPLSSMDISSVKIIPAKKMTLLFQQAGKILGRKLPFQRSGPGRNNLDRAVQFLNDLENVQPVDNT